MRHVKRKESMVHIQLRKKKQSTETVPEGAKILDLLDKDFKLVI